MKNESDYQFAAIIPARYASTRFPGKPLAMIGNKCMVQRVYEQALKSIDNVYIATDDDRIHEAVLKFGGNVIMTSPDHPSGTDRCAEAVEKIQAVTGRAVHVVINIQGDEPFIKPEQIDLLKACFYDKNVHLATLVRKNRSGEDIFNPNQPKVIMDVEGYAIYFSRAAIPYIRDAQKTEWAEKHIYYKHLGMYAYKTETLKKLTSLSRSPLEIAESLEQNRWIENGFKIKCAVTRWESFGIDTPEDLNNATRLSDNFD